jgi:protein gp37
MADQSQIEWTDATWNPVRGCTRVSPGCGGPYHQGGCYAEKIAARFSDPGQPFHGIAKRTKHGGAWTGKLALIDDMLAVPLRWKKPRRIFVNSMSDLFHENLPDEAIDKVFAVMALCPQHTFQVLTKRAARMRAYFAERWQATPAQRLDLGGGDVIDMPGGEETGREDQVEAACEDVYKLMPSMVDTNNDKLWDDKGNLKSRQFAWPLPNVWLGVSVEDQQRADERIPDLLAAPAAVRFLSCEPLLEPVDLSQVRCALAGTSYMTFDALHALDSLNKGREETRIDWVIAGSESGRNSRPCDIAWVRSLKDQCVGAGVPFFYKQAVINGRKIPTPELDGRTWVEFPR